jgi:hypothetical protein
MMVSGTRTSFFGEQLETVTKQAKLDGCKPGFQARLSLCFPKLSAIHKPLLSKLAATYMDKHKVPPMIRTTYSGNHLEIVQKGAK